MGSSTSIIDSKNEAEIIRYRCYGDIMEDKNRKTKEQLSDDVYNKKIGKITHRKKERKQHCRSGRKKKSYDSALITSRFLNNNYTVVP